MPNVTPKHLILKQSTFSYKICFYYQCRLEVRRISVQINQKQQDLSGHYADVKKDLLLLCNGFWPLFLWMSS